MKIPPFTHSYIFSHHVTSIAKGQSSTSASFSPTTFELFVQRMQKSVQNAPLGKNTFPLSLTYTPQKASASFYSPDLAEIARCWQRDNDYDAVLAFSSTMAQYVESGGRFRRVMDFVDVDSAKWDQYGQEAMWPLSLERSLSLKMSGTRPMSRRSFTRRPSLTTMPADSWPRCCRA